MHVCIQDEQPVSTLEFRACSTLEPQLLTRLLPAAILDSGGWVAERSEPRNGSMDFVVEFPCERSMDVYCTLVGLGMELSRHAHLSMTRLCQCARHGHCLMRLPIARACITVEAASVSESAYMTAALRAA